MARVLVMAGDLDGAELDTLCALALTRAIRDGAIGPILCDGEDLSTAVCIYINMQILHASAAAVTPEEQAFQTVLVQVLS